MPRYLIGAKVSIDVQMAVEAGTSAEAEAIFVDRLQVEASLQEIDEDKEADFEVYEECIDDIQIEFNQQE